jgi:hypothetical protein
MYVHIPEGLAPVTLLAPAADAGGRTGAVYVSLKNALKAFLVVHINQGNAATVAITPVQATAVAGTGSKVLTNNVPIWSNQDCVASSAYVRATDAANLTTSAGVKDKIIIFDIDPTLAMDMALGFDCISVTTGASNAANITSAELFVLPKFGGVSQPDYITD